jgi:hypothetical protein
MDIALASNGVWDADSVKVHTWSQDELKYQQKAQQRGTSVRNRLGA